MTLVAFLIIMGGAGSFDQIMGGTGRFFRLSVALVDFLVVEPKSGLTQKTRIC